MMQQPATRHEGPWHKVYLAELYINHLVVRQRRNRVLTLVFPPPSLLALSASESKEEHPKSHFSVVASSVHHVRREYPKD